MIEEIPKSWLITTLGSITTKPQYGWTAKTSSSGVVKYLRTTDLSKGKVTWDSVPYCLEMPEDLEKYQLYENDILISRAGSIGLSFRIKDVPANAIFASYLIRFKGLLVDPRYIEYFLKTEDYWASISNSSAGIAVQNVNAVKLSDISIPLAPHNEQKRIADRLDSLYNHLYALNERLDRIPVLLKQFRENVLMQAVTGILTEEWRKSRKAESYQKLDENNSMPFRIPNTWQWDALGSLTEKISYGTSKKSDNHGKVPVLRMGNLQNGKVDWGDLKYSSDEREMANYVLRPGDVLFNRTNSPELVGKTSIYEGERPAIYAGYIIRIVTKKRLNPYYLNFVLNSNHGRDWSWKVKSDGVSQSNINAKKLSAFLLPLPNIEEQEEIVKRVNDLFSIADGIEMLYNELSTRLNKLPLAILGKAFSGKLVNQDLNDESVSILLQKIKQMRIK